MVVCLLRDGFCVFGKLQKQGQFLEGASAEQLVCLFVMVRRNQIDREEVVAVVGMYPNFECLKLSNWSGWLSTVILLSS